MALPGKYTVKAYQVVGGEVSELTEAQNFTLKFLEINKQMGYDRSGIEAFAKEIANARNQLGKLNKVNSEFQKRVKYLHEAVIATPKADRKLIENLTQIDNQLNNLSLRLYGDKSLSKREFETSPSINNRLGTVVYYLWRTTSNPTSTQREQVSIAKDGLSFVRDELKSVKTQITDIQNQLKSAGVSYTPGWMPDIE